MQGARPAKFGGGGWNTRVSQPCGIIADTSLLMAHFVEEVFRIPRILSPTRNVAVNYWGRQDLSYGSRVCVRKDVNHPHFTRARSISSSFLPPVLTIDYPRR